MSDEEEGELTYSVVFDSEPEKKYSYLPPLDGTARAQYPNKDIFVGEFKDGKKSGKGCYTFANGSKYDGEYSENKKQGEGMYFAPDGGKYVGGWLADKRHGWGVYTYPTGDRYEGDWKNGTKHGKGAYIYANIQTKITGTWSNGQCVDGVWSLHDGSKFVGGFLGNQPAGDGLFEFTNGNQISGRYTDGKFQTGAFQRPHPNEKPPPMVEPTALRVAERLIDKAVCKTDHNTSMHVLKMEIAGLPNFRRAGATPLYACGQPSLDAFRKLNDTLTENGYEKVTACCLREDPVIYVSQMPFSPRDRKTLNTPVVLPSELTAANVKDLEARLAENVKFAIKRKGGLHDFYEEMYTDLEAPTCCTGNDAMTFAVKDPGDVRSISKLFEFLGEEDVTMEYLRIPIPEEKTPSLAAFDAITAAVRGLEGGAIVFNDAAGTSRATTATVIASLLVKEPEAEEAEPEAEDEEEGGEPKGPKGPKVPPPYDELEPNLTLGQYDIIMKLVRHINGPNKEELDALRVAEQEAHLAAKEAKRIADAEAKALADFDAAASADGGAEAAPVEEGSEAPAEDAEAPAEEAGEEEAAAAEEPAVVEEEKDDFVSKLPAGPSNLGDVLKMEVDDAIDRAAAVHNLRTLMLDLKKQSDLAQEDDQILYKVKAANHLERYFNFIVYSKYVKEQQGLGEEAFQTTFVKWSEGQTGLFEIFGSETFNWS